jgi:hypothetical protein
MRFPTPCADCRTVTLPLEYGERCEWYMLNDQLWDQIAPEDPGGMTFFLCIGCAETRLGRHLTAADFKDCPLNDLNTCDTMRYAFSWRTERLTNRLTT